MDSTGVRINADAPYIRACAMRVLRERFGNAPWIVAAKRSTLARGRKVNANPTDKPAASPGINGAAA
jgi:hypothetical protein